MSSLPIDKALLVKPYKSLCHSLTSSFIHCEALETESESQIKYKSHDRKWHQEKLSDLDKLCFSCLDYGFSAHGFYKSDSTLD